MRIENANIVNLTSDIQVDGYIAVDGERYFFDIYYIKGNNKPEWVDIQGGKKYKEELERLFIEEIVKAL